ncbi:hypothetical protein QFC19_000089 [Naganishia cerealis]|uniref:Uncharacterized protein n=1 Tax=Naganishia cerealis TaxID=610337 RepID=A0ACC2WRU6_9TREE|nr:hypothetical protein QFC19_000089 [Naganishia cerealis]
MKADEKEGKRQRQSQSCDACRVRKVKCEPVSGADGQVPATVSTGEPSIPLIDAADKKPTNQGSAGRRAPCKQCIQLGSDCTYEYVPRKRGPPNLYLRKLSEAKQAGMQFPSEADFEAAKASSRAVAERKKARGKGSAGHELEHVSEYAMKEEHDMDWRLTRSLEGKTEDVKSTGRLPGNPIPHNYEQNRRVSSETSNGTAESYVRTAMTGDGNAIAGGTSNFSTAAPSGTIHTTTAVLTDDAFTPSQFLDLQAELDYTATSAIGNPSPIAFKHHLPSGGDSYPSGLSNLRAFDSHTKTSYHRETAVQHSSKPLAMVDGAHANSHRLHAPSANRSILSENTHNPIISPLGFEQAGAYFTSPSDAGSSIGIANSHFVHRPPVADLPDRLVSTPSRRLSLDLALPEGVRNDFILNRTRTYSTTAVHRDSSASGTDNQLCLPTHPSNSQTIGEVGSTYLYNRAPAAIDQRRQSGTELHSQPPLTGSFTGQADVPGIEHGPASLYNNHGQPSLQPVNPLEAIIPRPLLQHIINLFFDYVYPLTPCLHKPTFLEDLARHREMEPGQGEWTVLVLAVIMSTLVQVPRAFVPLTRREVKDLAYRCHIAGRKWSLHGYKDFTVNAGKLCERVVSPEWKLTAVPT